MGRGRAYKLQEFPAHSAAVNSVKIGRKSSGVLVTGGDDKKVNMWAIGRPQAILVRAYAIHVRGITRAMYGEERARMYACTNFESRNRSRKIVYVCSYYWN